MDAEWRTKCRSAVIALFGRTPREGTVGHVASRRGLDRNSHGQAAATRNPSGAAGSRAVARRMEPVWTVARRAEAEARAEHPCHAGKQTRLPRNARRAANRARGRCRKRHVAAAASDGSAKCVEGLNAAMLRIRSASGIEATDRPSQLSYPTPAPRSRGAAVARLRAVRGPGASPPPVSGQREISPGRRPRRDSRRRGQGSDSAISATPCLANRSFSASPRSAWTVVSASAASRLSWRRTSGAK